MGTLTVTLTPANALTHGAKWCIVDRTGWNASGATITIANGDYTVAYKPTDDYVTPASEVVVVDGATVWAKAYETYAWPDTWGPPISMCLFRGQCLAAGKYLGGAIATVSPSRLIRWSEIGAFRWLGATARPEKNEAGEKYVPISNDDMVMRVLPMKHAAIVYSTLCVSAFVPVSTPAPTFQINELLPGVGIANPLAVASNSVNGFDDMATEHLFLDTTGRLWTITIGPMGTLVPKALGYASMLSGLQDNFSMSLGRGVVAIVYNPAEDEYYIGNGERSFLYNKEALTEIGATITSCIDLSGRLLASHHTAAFTGKALGCVSSLFGKDDIYIETDTYDFGVGAIKTITGLQLDGGLGSMADIQMMVKWRNNRNEPFRETPWRRCSPLGSCVPMVSGVDLRFCVSIHPANGTYISALTVDWKLSDKRFIRGPYSASVSSSQSNQ